MGRWKETVHEMLQPHQTFTIYLRIGLCLMGGRKSAIVKTGVTADAAGKRSKFRWVRLVHGIG